MNPIRMKIYNVINPKLKKYIRHYWITEGTMTKKNSMMILPMDHIDIMIPIEGKAHYLINGEVIEFKEIFFHGIRKSPLEVVQDGYVKVFGISFLPWGFYPFVNEPLSNYTNNIVDFNKVNGKLSSIILKSFRQCESIEQIISSIESILIEYIKESETFNRSIFIIEDFISNPTESIKDFCELRGIQRRRLERIFKTYVGISPKDFLNIRQFETASKAVLYNKMVSLTDIAYDSEYFDQAHFTKAFKKFTQYSPSKFKKEKPALKSKITIQ